MILASGSSSSSNISHFLLGLAVLLASAKILGWLARKLKQPAVVGEILAGVLLGPTLLGQLAPELQTALFPAAGSGRSAMAGFTTLCVSLVLLAAGMEVDLGSVARQKRTALIVGLSGFIVPAGLGGFAAWIAPSWLGYTPGVDPIMFAAVFGVAMSITALPLIAKILTDLGIFKSDLGVVIMASAALDDLIGWLAFAVIISIASGGSSSVGTTVVGVLIFGLIAMTLGRRAASALLIRLKSNGGSVVGLLVVVGLFGAAITELLGLHATFGAFIAGLALGGCKELREEEKSRLNELVSGFLAPAFFATIGLYSRFDTSFNLALTVIVFVIAMVVKVGGCYVGARIAGIPSRSGWALGFGMSARGAMEIILAQLAFQAGLIGSELLVSIVVMSIATSLISGPAIKALSKGDFRFGAAASQKQPVRPKFVSQRRPARRRASPRFEHRVTISTVDLPSRDWRGEAVGGSRDLVGS